jgi:HAD superfamily hydrolase (TIGR01490 family)
MKYAFFDVDNTLYDGYSASELIEFVNTVKPNKELMERYFASIEDYKLRKISYNEISQIALDITSECLKGFSRSEAQNFVSQMLAVKSKVFNDWVDEVIKYLKNNGYSITLVSAGPDLAIQELANRIDADEWFATEVPVLDDVYSGGITQLLNEEKKSELISKLLSDKEVAISIAFGDSTGDIPMLELVDHSFVVENDHHQEMMDYSNKKGWKVFSKAQEVIMYLEQI